jgi:hypothetical protein
MVTAHLEYCRRGKMSGTYERIKGSRARVAQQGLIHIWTNSPSSGFADALRT